MRNAKHIGAIILTAFLMSAAPVHAETEEGARAAKEYQVKAAFLYNFVKFVEWPGEKSLKITHAANICILGDDPFGTALDVFKQASSADLTLNVQRGVRESEVSRCNIVFIAASEQANVPSILARVRSDPVLTVSEQNGFVDNGGIIEMSKTVSSIGLFSKDKINLRINVKNAEARNLRIDPQLLEIAAEVIK